MSDKILELNDSDMVPMILYVPKGTSELTLNCKISGGPYDGEVMQGRFNSYELYDAMIDGEFYDSDHTMYHIVEED